MDISTLWSGSYLTLPGDLIDAYRNTLDAHGLLERANGHRPDPPPVGGHTQELTDEHFCHAFDGSAARVQLVYLDPLATMAEPSLLLNTFLSGGDLCLVDVPSGAGAGTLSLLSNVAHLRKVGELPREPMNVRLIWGEISKPAIAYAVEMLNQIAPVLATQAIFTTYQTIEWDVLDDVSNVELVELIVKSKTDYPQVLLIICNFSGFLERGGKWKEANKGLSMLLQFCSGDLNGAVWIEPNQESVVSSLFKKLAVLANKLIAFVKLSEEAPEGLSCNAQFLVPMSSGHIARVGARAMPIRLAIRRGL